MIAEADYKEGSGANLWLTTQLEEQADVIIMQKRSPYEQGPGTPGHLI